MGVTLAQNSKMMISKFLKEIKAPSHFFQDEGELLDKVCDAVEEEKIVGWFQG